MIKLKKMIRESNYKFMETMRDYHSGQSYMTAYAQLYGKVVGQCEYSIYDKKIYIQYIEVNKDERRKGVATKLMDFIRNENKGIPIIPGYATDEGDKFWKKYQKKRKL